MRLRIGTRTAHVDALNFPAMGWAATRACESVRLRIGTRTAHGDALKFPAMG
jgi:hypothetical protein